MAVFLPIYRCTGVDTSGMIVPLGGSNQVVLDTDGMAYNVEHPGMELEEFDGKDIGRQLIKLNNSLYDPSIDPNYRAAHLPIALYLEKPRFFRIFGRSKFSRVLKAVPVQHLTRSRMERFTASLQVECVQQKTIKVAIRNVKARDDQGNITNHAKTPCDPDTEIKKMNAVWIPQANIKFELVPSTELVIDDQDKATQEQFAKVLGLRDVSSFQFKAGGEVNLKRTSEIFAASRVRGAQITFFLVHKIADGASGTTDAAMGTSLIAGDHYDTTFAHEAGHNLGRIKLNGQWNVSPHLPTSETAMLMKGFGSSWAIEFELAKRALGYNGEPYNGQP